ncbi:MAG: hypothetical protein LBS31_03575 [Candidatus Adiutrix sp.]|nr:hypothetical protein [Candidatus Adiutrix sp.]
MKKRVFIGMEEIAGNASDLCRGFREIGYDCDFVSPFAHRFEYEETTDGPLIRFVKKAHRNWSAAYAANDQARRRLWKGLTKTALGLLFSICLFKYDAFIFYFNRTFSKKWRDLPILKFFGKKIIFVYVGGDARPPYLNGARNPYLLEKDIQALIKITAEQKAKLSWAEKYADYIVNWPPQAYFNERRFIHGALMGLPRRVSAPGGPTGPEHCRPIRGVGTKILHAPSKAGKGTELIRALAARLKEKGRDLEYIEISGQPNEVVLKRLAECDFVIDQAYADTPLAGLATEAAFFGKPAVVGGYFVDQVAKWLDSEDIPPSLYVRPEDMEQAVDKMIVDRQFRLDLGLKARRYVESHCRPAIVAAKYARLINGDAPESWLREPARLTYLYGANMPEETVREIVAALIEAGGVKALQLADKPELEKAFLELARQ